MSAGPLDGVKVIDLSVMISGPLATMLLADQGADVIKVESPGLGDLMRYLGSSRGGMTGLFAGCNRGKRGITIDLKHPEGVRLLRSMATTADVFVQNFRPGACARLGIGPDDLRAATPGLIYVSISGFGPTGPYSNRRVYDNVIQAYSGMAGVQTDPATGKPTALRNLVCDKVTAYTAAQAITAALFARERGAGGQHIQLAMLDAAIAFLWPDAAMDRTLLEDDAMRSPTIASGYSITPLADGYMTATALSDSEFRGLCAAIGRPEVADDPRFASLPLRMANLADLAPTMIEVAARTTVADFLQGAIEHDVPAAPILGLDDLPSDPQITHNELFVETSHPHAGRLREVRPAPRFGSTPARVSSPAPMPGEHTDALLAELGFDDARVAELRAGGVVH